MKRTVKKAMSAAMALVMTTGMFITGNGNVVKSYADEAGTYLNEKYVQQVDNGQYNNGITYDDGVILVSNVSESTYSSRCNLNKKVSLSSDSVLAYYDKNGKNHVLENKDLDGNKKYDAIYGTVSQMSYKYTIVEKNSKLGTIDNAGNQITLNNKEWYDDIDLYETEEGKYLYGLKENKDDKIFDYTLVDENGNVIFTKKDCTYKYAFARWITDVYKTYFMLFVDAEGYATLVDVNGKVWSEGKKYVKVGPTGWSTSHMDMTAVLVFDNEYGYYNYTTGEMYEKPGTIRRSNSKETRYMVNNDGKTYVYDRYMEAELIIDGEYADIVSINGTGKGKSAYLLKNSDNKYVNGCNKDGSKWFDEDFEIKDTSLSMNSAEGVILTYDDNSKYFVPDGGENQYLLSDLQSIAINKIKSVPGNENVELNNMAYVLADFGVVFYITINNVKYSAVVTKASGYKDAVYLEDGITGYVRGSAYGYIYLSSVVDKTITLNDGSTVECNKKMIKMYNMYSDDLNEIEMPDELYKSKSSSDTNYYTVSGDKYILSKGQFKKSDSSSKPSSYIKEIGDTGSYIRGDYTDNIMNGRRYHLFDANDEEIDIGLDEIYNGNNSSISLSVFLDKYVRLYYRDKNESKSVYKIYTYSGEYVMEYTGYMTQCDKLDKTYYFVDNMVIQFIDMSGQLNDSALREDSTIKIETIEGTEEKTFSGLKENSSVEDIKNELPGLEIAVIDSEGNTLNVSNKVGTGCTIQSIQNGKVVDTAKVVVKGDIDGTGTIDVLDMEAIQKSILGIGDKLSGAYKEAASLSGGVDITVLDMEVIQKDILGIEKIN